MLSDSDRDCKIILLIDDDERESLILKTCLEVLGGWKVIIHDDNFYLRAGERLDAILLDVSRLERGKAGDIDRIRSYHAPIVLLASRSNISNPEYKELESRGTVIKPFLPMGLTDSISRAMGW